MILDTLCLDNFRNYHSLEITFQKGINVLYGNNGQGKTNILESIYLLAIGKSFRYAKDMDLIRQDHEKFSVDAIFKEDITEHVMIRFNREKEKSIQINGLFLRKIGHLMGAVMAVLFAPEDMQLISDGPSVRRKFMDVAISQLKPSYFFDLQQYSKILMQKNNLLKTIKRGPKKDSHMSMLSVWNDRLAETGARIILDRLQFIHQLTEIAAEMHGMISGKKEFLQIKYDDSVSVEHIQENEEHKLKCEEIRIYFTDLLERRMEREIDREISLYGPHRDDLLFSLNEEDIKKFGSQGQKRTVILSLKMAELEIMKRRTGRTPLLLLDDVFSELDKERQTALIQNMEQVQTFITCVENTPFQVKTEHPAKMFFVKNGTVML